MSTDGLPENKCYVDTGCKWHPSCLHCPEPECLEKIGGRRGALRARRRRTARRLRAECWTVAEIAEYMGMNRRSVYRLLKVVE